MYVPCFNCYYVHWNPSRNNVLSHVDGHRTSKLPEGESVHSFITGARYNRYNPVLITQYILHVYIYILCIAVLIIWTPAHSHVLVSTFPEGTSLGPLLTLRAPSHHLLQYMVIPRLIPGVVISFIPYSYCTCRYETLLQWIPGQ